MDNKMVINHKEVEKVDMGKGVIRQDFAMGKNLNVLHCTGICLTKVW